MSFSEIVKNTLTHFRNTKEPVTPDNYHNIFCLEAKKLGICIHECERIERALGKLDPQLKKLAQDYRVRTPDELLTFLTAQLNRATNGNKSEEMLAAALLIKRLLLIIEAFPLRNLSKEARRALGREMTHPAVLADERNRWQALQESLEFGYLDTLDNHGIFDKADLPTLIEQVDAVLKASETSLDLAPIAGLLLESLRPTLAQANPKKLQELEKELKADAGLLTSQSMIEEIRGLLEHRVLLDTELLEEQTDRLSSMVDEFTEDLTEQSRFNNALEERGEQLTQALEKGEFTEAVKDELLNLARSTRGAFVAFNQAIKNHLDKTGSLKNKIAKLESEISRLRNEATEDYVTKIPNRRALTELLGDYEKRYEADKNGFILVFFQIDHYEALMDRLGRNSGEVILGTVAQFLKKQIEPKGATLGRYGGNTFLAILTGVSEKSAMELTKALVALMPRKQFLYEGRSFHVTLSGGLAHRNRYTSLKDTLSQADGCLRSAKLSGGNQVHNTL